MSTIYSYVKCLGEYEPMVMAFHILIDNWNVIGWLPLLSLV